MLAIGRFPCVSSSVAVLTTENPANLRLPLSEGLVNLATGNVSAMMQVDRRGGRAVECTALLMRRGPKVHRGFESRPLRSVERVLLGTLLT